ncbi:MAG: SMP-30/gluconolactonase/LRE family protein [Sphingomonas sp.]
MNGARTIQCFTSTILMQKFPLLPVVWNLVPRYRRQYWGICQGIGMAKHKESEADASLGLGGAQGAQTLSKVFTLLNLIADAPTPVRFNDLLHYSGLPKGSLHRMLQVLLDYRLVRLDDTTQTYRLGFRLFEMAHKVWSEFDIRAAAQSEIARLHGQIGETVRLGILDGDQVLLIEQLDQVVPMRLGQGVGARLTARASAIGKALLAYCPPAAIEALLGSQTMDPLTPNTILDPAEFQRELDLVKARGYAIAVEEQHLGVSAVAAPIVNHRGEALAAISIVGPSFRLTPDRLHALGRDVIEAARRISGNAGETFMSIMSGVDPVVAQDENVRCAVPSSALLGEAPCWLPDSGALLWVDILGPSVSLTQIETRETRTTPLSELVGVVVPRKRGGFIAATQSGIHALDLRSGTTAMIATPASMAGHRFNDGKCDPAGRFWTGTLALDATPSGGALYRLDVDGSLHEVERGFHICNGLGWSPDGATFYLTDSGARTIHAYDYDLASGTIANKRTLAQFDGASGAPDGMAVDAEGYLWCAFWDGWAVRRLAPDGTIDREIRLPVPRPTSCAFGGPNLDTLYVTSARIRLSATQLAAAPLSGSVFAVETGTRGVPLAGYGG